LLLQCPYSTAVDIWSAGCILAELYAREALFPGQTEAEQISIVFQKLGTPSTFMWPTDSVVDRSFYPSYPGIALERLMPKMPADGRQLIKSLLAFSPSQRMTAAQALKSIYFSNGSPLN